MFSLALVVSPFVQGEDLFPPESPVTCIEGEVTTLEYREHTIGCAIDAIVDQDFLTFSGAAGEDVRIVIVSTTTNMDPSLELRGPDGTVLDSQFCGNFLCEIVSELTLATSGTYSLAISDAGADETGGYLVQLERIPPTTPLLSLSIPYDFTINDGISPLTDVDFVTFEGMAGTTD